MNHRQSGLRDLEHYLKGCGNCIKKYEVDDYRVGFVG